MAVLRILLLLVLAALPVQAQIHALPHPDTTAGNYFGAAVALDGGRALVGATGEDACGPNSGAAYVFEPAGASASTMTEQARLVPDDCEPGSFFGRAVALAGDVALVAAGGEAVNPYRPNRVYAFERDSTGAWTQTAVLLAAPGHTEGAFATSVSLDRSADGYRALVTTSGDPAAGRYGGAAYVFERDPETRRWTRVARLTGSGGSDAGVFGTMGVLDSDRAVVTASPYGRSGTGTVYVFERDPAGTWQERARIGAVESDRVHADLDGDRLLVGHPRAGPDESGRAVLYGRTDAGRWRPLSKLYPSIPYRGGAFGTAVSLDGSRALVAGYNEQIGFTFNIDRVVYVFAYDGVNGQWQQQQILDLGAWAFGAALDHEGAAALVGYASDDAPGAAYLVRLR